MPAQLRFVLDLLQIGLLDFRLWSFKINLLAFYILISDVPQRRGRFDCSSDASFVSSLGFGFGFRSERRSWGWRKRKPQT